jgi:sugar phosphate isomerase/epimerase
MNLSWATPEIDALSLNEWEKTFACLSANGFIGIEPIITGVYKTPVNDILELLKRHHLRITGFRTGGIVQKHHVSFSDLDPRKRNEALDRFLEMTHYATEFGKPKLLVGLMQGKLEDSGSLEITEGLIKECVAVCCDESEKLGLEFDLEPVNHFELNYHNTVGDMAGFIREINKPNLKILIDTYHMYLEERSLEQAVFQAKGILGHVHLADSNRLIPSTGCFDFPNFFNLLKQIGYDGSFTTETSSEMDAENIIQASKFLYSFING